MKLPQPIRIVHTPKGDEVYVDGVQWRNVTKVTAGPVSETEGTVLTLTVTGPVTVEGETAKAETKTTAGPVKHG